MKLPLSAINLIKNYEGCYSASPNKIVRATESTKFVYPYLDPTGTPTIGWGNTHYFDDRKVTMDDDPLTRLKADQLFSFTLNKTGEAIRPFITANLSQAQFGSLVSFAYNCGVTAFKNSTLLKEINADHTNLDEIQKQFMRWTKSKGKELKGLVNRRTAEFELFKKKTLNFSNMKNFIALHKTKLMIAAGILAAVVIFIIIRKRK